MTKSEIESALNNVPDELKDATPSKLQEYFNNKIEGILPNEVDTLTAYCVLKDLSQMETFKSQNNISPWLNIRNNLKNKFTELGGSPDHPLWPVLEIAAAAEVRNKIALVL
jgi:hypothetical protein